MAETLITSSVLIAGICLLRALLKGRISPVIQYGMWSVAAFRLVLPCLYPVFDWLKVAWISNVSSPFSVMNAAGALRDMAFSSPVMGPLANNPAGREVIGIAAPVIIAERAAGIDWQFILFVIWLTGGLVLFVWMLGTNLRFARSLYMTRERYTGDTYGATKLPVYYVKDLRVPCFMAYMGDRAIYLPQGMEWDRERMRHILIHEDCHARHHDHIWGILRCVLLCYYWINPFVWAAAFLSKRDCELACDAAAVKCLGEDERTAYGMTLIDLTAKLRNTTGFLNISPDIWNGKNAVKERIAVLAKHPKTTKAAACLAALALLGLAVCTYTGQRKQADIDAAQAPAEAAQVPAEAAQAPNVEGKVPSGSITAEDIIVLAGVSDSGEMTRLTRHFPKPDSVDGEDEEGVMNRVEQYLFSYEGEPYELQISYMKEDGTLDYTNLQRLTTGEWLNIYETPESIKQYGLDLADKDGIRKFFASHKNMADYMTFNLPGELDNGGYLQQLGNGGGGNLFLTSDETAQRRLDELSRYVDQDQIPQEWRAAGAVQRFTGDWLVKRFEQGNLVEIGYPWNHSVFLTEPVPVTDGQVPGLLVLAGHDMYTPASLTDAEAEFGAIPEENQSSRMWYVFFVRPECDEVYSISLNADLYEDTELLEIAGSVHFTDQAWTPR